MEVPNNDILDAVQKLLESFGVAKTIWNGEITVTLYLQNGETSNRELNTKVKSRPPPKLTAVATK